MVQRVGDRKEISLNSVRYPIIGRVAQNLISVLPQKFVLGEYSLADEQVASTWVTNDQRGGILVEEMDEKLHLNRCWWSTCDLGFRGHIVLPVLATDCGAGGLSSKDGYVLFEYDGVVYVSLDEFLRSFDNTNDDFNDAVITLASNPTDAGEMVKTMFVACDDNGYYYNPKLWFPQQLTDGGLEIWTSATELTNWTEGGTGTLTQESSTITEGLYAAKFVSDAAQAHFVRQVLAWNADWQSKQITVTADVHSTISGDVYTGIKIADGAATTIKGPAGTGAYESVTCTHTINAAATKVEIDLGVVAAHASAQTVYVDNVVLSYSETTAPWITKSTISAKYLVEWDDKQFKINGENVLSYATDNATWTDKGQIPIDDDAVTALYTDKDADGDDIIYAATTQGLWAHDYANAKWIRTQLKPPDHPNSGRGADVWREGAFFPAGLDVIEYKVASTATIRAVGLDRDDGLPAEFDGEIMDIVPGYNEFYALLDASQATGTGYSCVMAYDGNGWQCKVASGTADKAIKCALVTSAYSEYRLFYATDNKVYHITLNRSLRNPKKIATHAYAISGMHITPWFDAGWIGGKLALSLKMMCDGMSSTEKITPYYRIDHSTATVPVSAWTDWTKLTSTTYTDGVNADGEAEFEFGTSGVGIAFKAIQFAFDFERTNVTPATDKLKTPDLQYVKLSYLKQLDKQWGWDVTVDCRRTHDGTSPSELVAAIETMATPGTLKEFTFRDESGGTQTHYVTLKNAIGATQTGQDWSGVYQLTLVAP